MDLLRKLARALSFVALATALLVGVLAASARIRVEEHTLLQWLCQNDLEPGGRYHSLQRFREAAAKGPVDVVVLGSSHAYRGFDPRAFAAAGRSMMNLGSTNQTPLNSYYVAERYLPELRPKLVIVELYQGSLASDGLESTRDLTVNTPSSWPMARMAVHTWNLDAMTFALAKALRLAADDAAAVQEPIAGEVYVEGGYCESRATRPGITTAPPARVTFAAEQVDWLVALTARAKERGARVVWVTHPLPRDEAQRIANRAELRAELDAAARRAGVPYWDFQDALELDPLLDFQDAHHLNASGVARFDAALLERLRDAGAL